MIALAWAAVCVAALVGFVWAVLLEGDDDDWHEVDE